jgi:AAA family ATP:ADP antiporter
LLLMIAVPIYSWLGTRLVRVRLIASVTTFFAVTLVAFYFGGLVGLREGFAFYIWIGLINVFIVSQFWQFANDLYTEGQGRRLFPFIGVGQSLGAWVGAAAVAPLVRRLNYTPCTLMVLGAGVLMFALVLTLMVNARATERGEGDLRETGQETLGLIVLLNVVNTTGQYILNRLIVGEAATGSAAVHRRSWPAGSSSRLFPARSPRRRRRRSTPSSRAPATSSRREPLPWARVPR